MKKVGIVVVTYNRLVLLKEVVESLRCQTYTNGQIIVVNNGSTDDTLSWLQQQNDIITITQDNLGGAGGFHTGMKYVAEHGYDYCWVMDDDVICESTALEELLKAYQVKEDIGFVCSRVIGIDGRPMNTPTPAIKSFEEGTYSDVFELVEHAAMVRVQMATFVSVLIPISVIGKIGLPFKEYFIWGDDSEYTLRISSRFRSYIACRSVVVHKRSLQLPLSFYTETDQKRLKNYYYKFRNAIYTDKLYKGKKHYVYQIVKYALNFITLAMQGKWNRSWIVLKALCAAMCFRTILIFPENPSTSYN